MGEFNNNKRIFKFKRVFFKDMECTEFSHARDWGVGIGDSEFTSPSTNNFAPYYKDFQYFEIRGVLYCEGDIINVDKSHPDDEDSFKEIIFEIGMYRAKSKKYDFSFNINDTLLHLSHKVVGKIYENSDLLK